MAQKNFRLSWPEPGPIPSTAAKEQGCHDDDNSLKVTLRRQEKKRKALELLSDQTYVNTDIED
jgi:hypothetical protein